MKDVTDLAVKQYLLFKQDAFPLRELRSRTNVSAFEKMFSFGTVGVLSGTEELAGQGGSFRVSDRDVTIEQLQLSGRRIVATVIGSSDEASEITKALVAFVAERTQCEIVVPVLVAHETTCVVTLDLEMPKIFAPGIRRFVSDSVPNILGSGDAKASVKALHFSLEVEYDIIRPEVIENRLTLSGKTLTIEPRGGSRLTDCRYYTASPTDSSTHLELVKTFERHALEV